MGNSLLGGYDFEKNPSASGGAGMLWQSFRGKDKKTRAPVSLFIMQRKMLPKALRGDAYWTLIKKDSNTLTRLRHPHILDVKRAPLDERGVLVTVTEPVVASLANLMGDHRGLKELPAHQEAIKLTGLDLKNGLRQLVECLEFLHHKCNLVHGHVDPANIYLTPGGHWKLAGFCFTRRADKPPAKLDYTTKAGARIRGLPSLNFVAPELVLNGQSDYLSDIYSLGQVAFHAHKHVSPNGDVHPPDRITSLDEYKAYIQNLHRPLLLEGLPPTLHRIIARMLAGDPSQRPELREFLSCDYYNDVLVRTLRFLDGMLQQDVKKRVQFLRQLPKVIGLFDARSAEHKVLPKLMLQFNVGEKGLMLFCLPAILKIAERMESKVFEAKIVPVLRKCAKMQSPQFLYVVMSQFGGLIDKASETSQQKVLVPLILTALASKQSRLQSLALKRTVECANQNKFAYDALRQAILPQLRRISKGPGPAEVRAGALDALNELFQVFDKVTIKDQIVPAVAQAIKFGKSPVLIMSAASALENLSKSLGAAYTGTRLLPMLVPLMMESCLSKNHVERLGDAARRMLDRVVRTRLEHLSVDPHRTSGIGVDTKDIAAALDDTEGVGKFSDLLAKEYGTDRGGAARPRNGGARGNAAQGNDDGEIDLGADFFTGGGSAPKPAPKRVETQRAAAPAPRLRPSATAGGSGDDAFSFMGGAGGGGGSRAQASAPKKKMSATLPPSGGGDLFGDLLGGGGFSGASSGAVRSAVPAASAARQQVPSPSNPFASDIGAGPRGAASPPQQRQQPRQHPASVAGGGNDALDDLLGLGGGGTARKPGPSVKPASGGTDDLLGFLGGSGGRSQDDDIIDIFG